MDNKNFFLEQYRHGGSYESVLYRAAQNPEKISASSRIIAKISVWWEENGYYISRMCSTNILSFLILVAQKIHFEMDQYGDQQEPEDIYKEALEHLKKDIQEGKLSHVFWNLGHINSKENNVREASKPSIKLALELYRELVDADLIKS